MSVFKRANWHSGLTYRQTCHQCKTVISYKDDSLGFRPWFPDGFVYCPKCQTPLRHNENYAIDSKEPSYVDITAEKKADSSEFCANCGNRFNDSDKFCPQCGTKR